MFPQLLITIPSKWFTWKILMDMPSLHKNTTNANLQLKSLITAHRKTNKVCQLMKCVHFINLGYSQFAITTTPCEPSAWTTHHGAMKKKQGISTYEMCSFYQIWVFLVCHNHNTMRTVSMDHSSRRIEKKTKYFNLWNVFMLSILGIPGLS